MYGMQVGWRTLPEGWEVTAGMECMAGSAMYLIGTCGQGRREREESEKVRQRRGG